MFSKKCPKCGEDVYYKSKNSLQFSIRKNSVCKKCKGSVISEKLTGKILSDQHKKNISKKHKGKILSDEHKVNIGLSVKGLKRSDESKKRYSKSKLGDKNPAKRQEVRDKIRKTILEKYQSDLTYKERISETLIKYFQSNPNFINFDELSDFEKFAIEVRRYTGQNKKILLKNWDGYDFYDNEFIKEYFNFHYNDEKYPTIDHKIPVVVGFKNGYSSKFIGSISNLCLTKRRLNNEKYLLDDEQFKDKLKK